MHDAVDDAGGVEETPTRPSCTRMPVRRSVRPAMPGAGHGAVFDLPIAEGTGLMQAQIIDGKEASVQPENRDLPASDA